MLEDFCQLTFIINIYSNTFFPAEEGDQIQFSVQVPPGSKIETLSNVISQVTQQLKVLSQLQVFIQLLELA